MDDATAATLAGKCHRALDALHSAIYFAPDAEEKLVGAGLRPGRMTYFAARSAPMGAVGAGTVAATFYNFNPETVARHIPRAWTLATPAQVVAARLEGVDVALRRLLGDAVGSPELAEAAALAREASDGCTAEGRPLYAGHAELDWPSEPHLVLWHAVTLLREFRGDGHIAALVGASLDGLSALVTHTATGRGFSAANAKFTRGWSDEQWTAAVDRLREDGILDDAGQLSAKGVAQREELEAATDRAAVGPFRLLGEERSLRLREIGKTLSRRVIDAGGLASAR